MWLVVVRDEGALGLLLGNYVASAVVLIGLWWRERDALGLPSRAEQLGADAALRAADRPRRGVGLRAVLRRPAVALPLREPGEAGLYSLSVKLAGIVVFTVRAFQYAWPPLAYSIDDDAEAARVYARITTYYVLFTGLVVAGLALLGRWLVRIFAAPEFFAAHEALPWVALGWALYGLFLVLVAMAGRAQVTVRNAPAALCGLVVNVALLALLVPPLGIAGAGLALVGRLRRDAGRDVGADPQPVPGRVRVGPAGAASCSSPAALAVAGELLLPTDGAVGLRHPRARAGRDPARARGRALLPARRARGRPRPAQRAAVAFSRRLNSSAASARPSPRRGKQRRA